MPSCHVCRSSHRLIGQVQDQQPASEVTGLGKVSNQLCAAHVSDVQSVTSHMSVGIPAQGTTTVSKPNVSSKHGHVNPGTATAPTADASSGGGGRPESPEPRGVVRQKRQQTGIPLIPADSAPVEPMQPARRQGQTHGVHFVSVPPGYGGKMGYGTRPVSILDYDLKLSDTGSPCAATTDVEHGECPGADHASSGGPSTCSASARAHDLRHRLSEDWSADAHTMIHPHASADW